MRRDQPYPLRSINNRRARTARAAHGSEHPILLCSTWIRLDSDAPPSREPRLLQARSRLVRVDFLVLLHARHAARRVRQGEKPEPRDGVAAVEADTIRSRLEPAARCVELNRARAR